MQNYLYHFLKWSKSFIFRPIQTTRWLMEDFKKDSNFFKFRAPYKRVWCAGLPKSGTTLVEKIMDRLPYVSLNNSILRLYYPGKLDHDHGISDYMFRNIPKNKLTFLKTHTHYDKRYEKIANKYNLKIIISMRDIRDMLISRYFHILNDKNHWLFEKIKNLNFTDGFIYSLEARSSENLPNALNYYYYWIFNWHTISKKKNYLVLWYEDYIKDRKSYIKKIINYLELDEISILEIDSKLIENKQKNKSLEKSLKKYGRLRDTFRQGEKDVWKKYFNDEINTFLKKNIPDSIEKITYEKLNNIK